jgi:hypothetical protein
MRPKIYSCYSDSHLPLLHQHFLPSIPPWADLVLRKVPQACPSGTYRSEGWGTTMEAKVRMILEAIEAEKQTFIVSDVDIHFYDFQLSDLGFNSTIACQQDRGTYCCGFMMIKPSNLARQVFETTLEAIPSFNSEQRAFNQIGLPKHLSVPGLVELLPEKFWNCPTGLKLDIPIPMDIALHHGNWVEGVSDKLKLMDEVSRRIVMREGAR